MAELLGDAAEWRLLSLLLSRPAAGWREEVRALAREASGELGRAAADLEDATEGAYHALLGPGAPASPREAAHAGFLDPGRILADLQARYQAFAFAARAGEPADHLAVECDFVSYLLLKEAYALARGEPEQADIARQARLRFLTDHLAPTGRRFAEKLPALAPGHLREAARALTARLPDVPAPPEAPADEEEAPLECPT
jgi:TorA maturation chaperone TorD